MRGRVLDFAKGKSFAKVDHRLVTLIYCAAVKYYILHGGQERWVRVTEGIRTHARQAELVKAGKSWTENSYHCKGLAVDVAILEEIDGEQRAIWELDYYKDFYDCVEEAASELGLTFTWGGWWKQVDAVHFQLETLTSENLQPIGQ